MIETNNHHKSNDFIAEPSHVLAKLTELNIAYELFNHEPVFTVEQGQYLHEIIPGGHCKNLFLKDKKQERWLISAIEDTKIDLKYLHKRINSGRLSFGSPERLWESLKVKPGSVTPFALINDHTNHMKVVLDQRLFDFDVVNFHPLVNTQSIALAPDALLTYIKDCGHKPMIVDLSALDYNTKHEGVN